MKKIDGHCMFVFHLPCRKRLKKFLSKTASKIKHKADEQFHKEEELSEEESLPDIRSVKVCNSP